MAEVFDLAVIGGGPGGYTAAISASKQGLNTILFEKAKLGGVCLNCGCIPTKYFLDKAALITDISNMAKKGIFRETGMYSFSKLQEGKKQVVSKLVGGVKYLLQANGITVVEGEALLQADKTINCNSKKYIAKNIIIATGSKPAIPPIPGAEYTLDSSKLLEIKKVPARLAVIGGGVIGMELASAFNAFGSKTTILEMMPELFSSEEPSAIELLITALRHSGLKIHTDCMVKEIRKTESNVTVICKDHTFEADVVLMAAGRRANVEGIDIVGLGLSQRADGSIKTNEHMLAKSGIYAIGDAAGGYQLAHAAFAEAETAVAQIVGINSNINMQAMPRCVYTLPPFAAVGITAMQAEEKGIETKTGSFLYAGNGMALAENAEGCVYVIADKSTGCTLGVQIVGEGAPEMIALATQAVTTGMNLDEWKNLIIAHPSLSEMLREAAMDCDGFSVHGAVKKNNG